MSKAFTRESDDDFDFSPANRPSHSIPAGGKNYMTRAGVEGLRAELHELLQRKGDAANVDARRKLHDRIRYLDQILESAVIVDPPDPPWSQVRFGATVAVRYVDGEEAKYQIVGAAEADPAGDRISWCSPLAAALMDRQLGERVRFRAPAGEQELEIVRISY